jgi:hypothetical protein
MMQHGYLPFILPGSSTIGVDEPFFVFGILCDIIAAFLLY